MMKRKQNVQKTSSVQKLRKERKDQPKPLQGYESLTSVFTKRACDDEWLPEILKLENRQQWVEQTILGRLLFHISSGKCSGVCQPYSIQSTADDEEIKDIDVMIIPLPGWIPRHDREALSEIGAPWQGFSQHPTHICFGLSTVLYSLEKDACLPIEFPAPLINLIISYFAVEFITISSNSRIWRITSPKEQWPKSVGFRIDSVAGQYVHSTCSHPEQSLGVPRFIEYVWLQRQVSFPRDVWNHAACLYTNGVVPKFLNSMIYVYHGQRLRINYTDILNHDMPDLHDKTIPVIYMFRNQSTRGLHITRAQRVLENGTKIDQCPACIISQETVLGQVAWTGVIPVEHPRTRMVRLNVIDILL